MKALYNKKFDSLFMHKIGLTRKKKANFKIILKNYLEGTCPRGNNVLQRK